MRYLLQLYNYLKYYYRYEKIFKRLALYIEFIYYFQTINLKYKFIINILTISLKIKSNYFKSQCDSMVTNSIQIIIHFSIYSTYYI